MKKTIALLFGAIFIQYSCNIDTNNIKEKATKIVDEKKIEVDSLLNEKIEIILDEVDSTIKIHLDNTLNKVDTLLNH